MGTAELEPITTQHSLSPAKAWVRALELTAPIASRPNRIFSAVVKEVADQFSTRPALLSKLECLSYRELVQRAHQYARWALNHGVAKGDVVCLMMPNRAEYMAIWMGITSVGGVVALVNTNLNGPALAHAFNIVAPEHIIIDQELVDQVRSAKADITGRARIWTHGFDWEGTPRIDSVAQRYPGRELEGEELRPVTIDDWALYIYTSGTTGAPKAARVSHARLMQWTHWFAGMLDIDPSDRLYNCLPMYHSAGGVLATGAVLTAGGSVVIRESFSASRFWEDVSQWDCTLFQYIGELCRYLLNTAPDPHETEHRLRICCGNGLRPEIWNEFKTRFRIPQIVEFYAATEGNVSLFNVEGKPGAIGRVPRYLAHRFPAALVRFDFDAGAPARDRNGFCVRCRPNETGEAIGKVLTGSNNIGSRYEGYSDAQASEAKILRDVFARGDAWYRTGDLMRQDEHGYFYFVDRIGDTFRWKGENVSTSQVAEVICALPGVQEACVYGVCVPGTEGRAGMALIVTNEVLDFSALWRELATCLPDYAMPVFLRVRCELGVTSTFKYTKAMYQRQGFNPEATGDPVYFNDRECRAFVPLDPELYERIRRGEVRL